MNSKKIFHIVSILLVLAVSLCLFIACDKTPTPPAGNNFLVTFNYGYNDKETTSYTNSEGKVVDASNPTRSGYTFGGWFFDEACTLPVDFATEVFTSATTVFAKWTPMQSADSSHVHDVYGPAWQMDNKSHWKICTCGEIIEQGAHDSAGVEGSCCVCGREHSVESTGPVQAVGDYVILGLKDENGNADWTYGIQLVENPDHEGGKNEVMLTGVQIDAGEEFKIYINVGNISNSDRWVGTVKDGVTVAYNNRTNGNITVPDSGVYDFYYDINAKCLWIQKAHSHSFDTTTWASNHDGHWHACTTGGCVERQDFSEHTATTGICGVCGFDCDKPRLETDPTSNVKLMGVEGDWSNGLGMIKTTDDNGNEQYQLIGVEIKAGITIKVKNGDTWYGFERVETNPNISASGANDGYGGFNISLAAGVYNVYYKPATNSIWIELFTK